MLIDVSKLLGATPKTQVFLRAEGPRLRKRLAV